MHSRWDNAVGAAPQMKYLRLARNDRKALTYTTPPATDDWPYLYLDQPRIPLLFGLLAQSLLAILIGVRQFTNGRDVSVEIDSSTLREQLA